MVSERSSPRAERAPQDLLQAPGRVDVRGVEEVDPHVEAEADQTIRLCLGDAADGLVHPLAAEGHGPEADLRDAVRCGRVAGSSSRLPPAGGIPARRAFATRRSGCLN